MYDPRLINLIPENTLNKFEITYEEDDFHIDKWTEKKSNSSDEGSSDSNMSVSDS